MSDCPAAAPSAVFVEKVGSRELQTLAELNRERAARRRSSSSRHADGEQRLVKAKMFCRRSAARRTVQSVAHGQERHVRWRARSCSSMSTRRPRGSSSSARCHISQALAPIAQSLGYDVTVVDPRTGRKPERSPTCR